MNRHLLILICSLLFSVASLAESELPIIEIKADRTFIYPQRMELSGEESLMDVLLMVPDLLAPDEEMRAKAERIFPSLYEAGEYLREKMNIEE